MVLAVAYEDAKKNQVRRGAEANSKGTKRGGVIQTPFFGSRSRPDSPLAALNRHDPGRWSCTHFHTTDQFQVIVDGGGTLGRHELAPISVHFSRAYTPYGPILSDAEKGLAFFVMRTHADTGSLELPDEQEQLDCVVDRRPWQITRQVYFPDSGSAGITLHAVLEIRDEQGLAVYALSMKSNAETLAPDPAHGDGQYVLVLKGSLLHGDKEHKAWALVFVGSNEGPFPMRAGTQGLEALILNFPQRQARATNAIGSSAANGLKTWQCALCAFVYDEAAGLPHEGIAPGTRWQDVPATWSCPDCSASKADFQIIEI